MTPRLRLPIPAPFACMLFILGASLVCARPAQTNALWIPLGMGASLGSAAGILSSLALRRPPSAALVVIALLGLGAWRAAASEQTQTVPWEAAPTAPIRASAVVESLDERGQTAYATVKLREILAPDRVDVPNGWIQLRLGPLPPLEAGDRVEIVGRVIPVRSGTANGDRLLARGVVAISSYPRITVVDRAEPGGWMAALSSARVSVKRAIDTALPEPEASLLEGLLIGSAQGTPDAFQQALVASGTTHIVVVSGFNITLVAATVLSLVRRLGRLGTLIPIAALWLFALFAGPAPPTLRAAIMATLAFVALRSGRAIDALATLAITSAIMVDIDPRLVADLSFQLSALATLGLIALQPRVSVLLRWLPEPGREPLSTTIAAQLATLPVIATTFHQVSVVSPLANLLVAPLIPVATIVGAAGVAIVLAVPSAASLVGTALQIPCRAIVEIIEASARVPAATMAVGDVSPLIIAILAFGLIAWAVIPTPEGATAMQWLQRIPLIRPVAIGTAALLAVSLIAWSRVADADAPLVITAFDVGQGDAIFIRTPRGRAVLIDGGPNPSSLLNDLGRHMGIAEHELAVTLLTRADSEHLPGLIAATERYPSSLYLSPEDAIPSALFQRWRSTASEGRWLPVQSPIAMGIEPNVEIEIVPTQPLAGAPGTETAVQRSLAVRVTYGSTAVLLAESAPPDELLRAQQTGWTVQADALIIPRHGASNAIDPSILSAINPSASIISVGTRNREGSPSRDVLGLLSNTSIYRTDTEGSIELRSDGNTIWVTTERAEP